ncbi:hypothetical protein UPYG_G00261740 [Umbra pygmaea]|uniref:Uncharacterized protein n=1 Tax=Umbra pygmaea TaxID=75934 RepID=A0ABD0WAN4_UMBPY
MKRSSVFSCSRQDKQKMTSSCHNTRKRGRQFEKNALDEDYGIEVPPMTAKQPMNQELLQWKNKAEMLQARVEELEAEKTFLRQQLDTLISQKQVPDTPASLFLEDEEEQWHVSMSSDSSLSEEDSSEEDSSEEEQKKKKKKKKKKSKKAKRLRCRDDDRGKRGMVT